MNIFGDSPYDTIMLALAVIGTLAAIGFFRKSQIKDRELVYIAEERDNLQRRLNGLLEKRETVDPSSFLDQLSIEVDEGRTEKAEQLVATYIANHRKSLAQAFQFQAEATLSRVQDDGDAAVAQAEEYLLKGQAIAPNDKALKSLTSEIEKIKGGVSDEIWNLQQIDPRMSVDDLLKAGNQLRERGQYLFAKKLLEAARNKARSENGVTTITYARTLSGLGALLSSLADFDRAELLLKQAVEISKVTIGREHPEYANCLNNLANFYRKVGQLDQAESLHNQALEIVKSVFGKDHPSYASSLNNLAAVYRDMGRLELANFNLIEASEITKATMGEENPLYATCLNNIAKTHFDMGQFDQAEPIYKRVIEIDQATIGVEHPEHSRHLNNLANLYRNMGLFELAQPLFLQAIKIAEATLGPDHPNTKTIKSNYAKMQP